MYQSYQDDENSLWKRFQRNLLTSLSKHLSCYVLYVVECVLIPLRSFFSLLFTSCVILGIAIGLHYYTEKMVVTDDDYCSKSYRNNIGHRSFSDNLCYPTIDAVYVWTNRSDPKWIKDFLYYQDHELPENSSHRLLPSQFRDDSYLKLTF